MKKINILMIFLFVFIILSSLVSTINITLISPANNSILHHENISFAFNVNRTSNCSIFINSSISNQTIENVIDTNVFPLVTFQKNGTYIWNVTCNATTTTGNSEDFTLFIQRFISQDVLNVLNCPTNSIPDMMVLYLIILISLFFIGFGFTENHGVVGFFGTIMLMITTWYLSPCQNFFAFVVALFSFVLLIIFAIKGMGVENKTFK